MPYHRSHNLREIFIDLGIPGFRIILSRNMLTSGRGCFSLPNEHRYFEFYIAAAGTHFFCIQEHLYKADPLELYVIRPGEIHYELSQSAADMTDFSKYAVSIAFDMQSLQADRHCTQPAGAQAALFSLLRQRRVSLPSDILYVLERMNSELTCSALGSEQALQALGTLFMTQLLRSAVSEKPAPSVLYSTPGKYLLEEYFYFNFSRPVTADDMARHFHISTRYLNTLLQETYGLSFTKKLLQLRLETAKAYLSYSDKSVQEIITLCGFSNPNYFYSKFKAAAGVSPLTYRQLHRCSGSMFFDIQNINPPGDSFTE